MADASDVAGHLLDAAYAGLLSAEERRLRDRLRDLAGGAGQDERDTPAWARVEALLEDLGGPAGDRRPSGGAGPAGMNGSSMDPPPPPVVEGEGLRLRLATAADLPAMLQIIAEPEVAPWWPLWVPAEEELLGPDHATYVIEAGGGPGGILMVSEDPTPGYRSAGMDIAVSGRLHGRRVGRRALVAMARHLFEERGHHRLTIDPAAANARAVHAYRSIGFRPVGTMRAYERGPDGEWRDGLLMDMLAGELTSP